MVDSAQAQGAPNRLLSFSLDRPVLVMFVLFLVAVLIKILDTFVFGLVELLGESILTKSLGLCWWWLTCGPAAENCGILVFTGMGWAIRS